MRLSSVSLRAIGVALGLGVSDVGDTHAQGATVATPPSGSYADSATWIEMRNVDLRIDEHGAVRIELLRGQVLSANAGNPAVLDDAGSFSIRVTRGHVALTGEDLSALLNTIVFNYPGAPLKRLRARVTGKQVELSGTLHKGVDLPFKIAATPTLEPDGRVRMHPSRVRLLGIDGAKLMRALGLHLDDLVDLRKAHGARVEKDDILLEPMLILPPPAIEGRLAWIRVQGDRIVQEFVPLALDSVFERRIRPDSAAPNFVYFRGGLLRFGKLEMTDTDLQIIDADQHDPFDLYLPKYNRQLVAGLSRNLPNYGLRVEMPDYADLDTTGAPVRASVAHDPEPAPQR